MREKLVNRSPKEGVELNLLMEGAGQELATDNLGDRNWGDFQSSLSLPINPRAFVQVLLQSL